MFVSAVESYQQIRYRVYYIMLNQHVFKNALPFMSQGEILTTNSVNKINNAISRCYITLYVVVFT